MWLYGGVPRRNLGSQGHPAIAQGHHAQVTAKRLEVEAEFGKRLCHLQLYINNLKHNAAF